MSGIINVFLLLAVLICISKAQLSKSAQNCQCLSVRDSIMKNSRQRDIQIYPATMFCNKVEIVVTTSNGRRYCLNPDKKAVQDLVLDMINKKTPTVRRAQSTSSPSSNPDSSSTAHN
ncbi:C-X-C motif chemokine 10-like [Solea senegalensis]|uniref:C-X-C motif chemokine 10-like n=1 Tax=Solea senegalensis TaxID=28829 RepID=A0AAV6SMR9_SOLSE|nr:C-X-C motif chemokine 10-like [Solea senegalensis]